MKKPENRLSVLALFTFLISPVLAWLSILASDETAVFASLSRMIWYTGSFFRILVAMLALFIPMLISFFSAHSLTGMSKTRKTILRICMIFSCAVLYVGAMWVMPSI